MQAIYLMALDPVAEVTGDRNSYGFRKERSCADAIEQCRAILAHHNPVQWVLEGDIKACFDRISHDWLLANVPLWDKAILKQWLRAGYMESSTLYATEDGTPQGGIISPVLANLALDGLEAVLRKHFPRHRRGRTERVNLVRYADDFIITGCSKELLETQVRPLVEAFLSERGLELSPEKTLITHVEDGFDFLGQNVRSYGGKIVIKPSKKNVSAFLTDIRKVVGSNKAATAGHLIWQLNPKIKGWAVYHRHVNSSPIFQRVDNAIYNTLWQWAKRRHHNKGVHWIQRKYFTFVPGPLGGNRWTYFGEIKGRDDKPKRVVLTRASRVHFRRHIKIQAAVNPYASGWQEYLKRRHGGYKETSKLASKQEAT